MTATETEARGLRLSVPTNASGRESLKRARHAVAVLEVPCLNPETGRTGCLNVRGCLL